MYRPEHPRPQFERANWTNLNGKWEFEISDKKSIDNIQKLAMKIEVPFCPESKLSGIEHKDFMKSVWYRRVFNIDKEKLKNRVILHFGAVDYVANVFVNGKKAGSHKGGYTSFSFDITELLKEGENVLCVNALDNTRNKNIPSGKQSPQKESYLCMYTRTTGIWQTVWLEYVPKSYIKNVKITPNIDYKTVRFEGEAVDGRNAKLNVDISLYGKKVKNHSCTLTGNSFDFTVRFTEDIELWEPDSPTLYDLEFKLEAADATDCVHSYFGFRKVSFEGKKFLLNNKPIFLSQVLDQGFYPDGIYTAPSDADLQKDIDLSMELGFNGARLHEKVFEERFLYHCDRKGYLVWGEYPNWSVNLLSINPKGVKNVLDEWTEAVERDYNHPSIIGWCPLNETWGYGFQPCDYKSQKKIYDLTLSLDSTRPCIGSSGGDLFVGEINDIHRYNHNIENFKKEIVSCKNGHSDTVRFIRNIFGAKLLTKKELHKMPLYVSEYGGMTFKPEGKIWGYHSEYKSEDDVVNKYIELLEAIYDAGAFGLCYTQLYDVEQEQNGLLKYDRSYKLSKEGTKRIADINRYPNK